ncbi:hypothetical protein [Mesorhizobium sp. NPDC059025]|uniref:hypothetical protein n=1 Tax=unclassified Mesorhizobium TaxID=325217 RepID=UPI00367A99C9
MNRMQRPLIHVSALALIAFGVITTAFAGGADGRVSTGFETMLASLPIPAGYGRVRDADIAVDGSPARLIRYERRDGRNPGLGGEHFSVVVDLSGKLKGFTRMDMALRDGTLPSQEEARTIAMRFLSSHAPDLLPNLRISFIAPHDEQVRVEGGPVTLPGMKVKMRDTADGRWFWVIVGADREVMVFERDIVWANLQGRRTTELWLHDGWLVENTGRLRPRDA